MVARSKLETLRGQPFDQIVSSNGRQRVDEVEFVYRVDVTEISPPDPREKRAVCEVSWAVKNGSASVRRETRVLRLFEPEP